jgi:hypothetical protein
MLQPLQINTRFRASRECVVCLRGVLGSRCRQDHHILCCSRCRSTTASYVAVVTFSRLTTASYVAVVTDRHAIPHPADVRFALAECWEADADNLTHSANEPGENQQTIFISQFQPHSQVRVYTASSSRGLRLLLPGISSYHVKHTGTGT